MKKKILKLTKIATMLLTFLFISVSIVYANEEESFLDSGNHGVDWRLSTDGVLYLSEGTLQDRDESSYRDSYPWSKDISKIKKVVIEGKVILPEKPRLFSEMDRLIDIKNIDLLDTSKVTDMSYMFYYTKKLENLDLSSWDTSNVTNMRSMFNEAVKLKDIKLENWDVSNVENMSSMFQNTPNLETLDLENWNVSDVNDMSNMFHTDFTMKSNLSTLKISNWDVSNVVSMQNMFNRTNSLKSLDLSKWDVSNVKNMRGMFSDASSLVSLNLSNWNTSNVENTSYMFQGANQLIHLDLSGWDVSNVSEMMYMFEKRTYSPAYEILNLSNWKLSGITDIDGMLDVRRGEKKASAEELDLSNWNVEKLYNFNFLKNFGYIKTLKVNNWKETDELRLVLNEISNENTYLEIIGLNYRIIDVAELSYGDIPTMTYIGEQLKPNIEVYDGEYKLVEGVDYELDYGDNIGSNSGGSIYIKGKDLYNQSQNKYIGYHHIGFDILPAKVKLITLPEASSIYKGRHLSESIISGGKIVDEFGREVKGTYQWDWNNIDNQMIYKNGEYRAYFFMDNYEPLYFKLKVEAKSLKGWIKENNKWYYYQDDIWITGWKKLKNRWYYMAPDGVMQTGWIKLGNTWYYMSSSGAMQTGWTKLGNTWYYMSSSGVMQTGWIKLGRSWYYLNSNGSMQTSNKKIGNKWYRFDSTGRML